MNSLRRSPHGERGLKFVLLVDGLRGLGRSPHGERGLKSVLAGKGPSDWVSLSSWRAWIEMPPSC